MTLKNHFIPITVAYGIRVPGMLSGQTEKRLSSMTQGNLVAWQQNHVIMKGGGGLNRSLGIGTTTQGSSLCYTIKHLRTESQHGVER